MRKCSASQSICQTACMCGTLIHSCIAMLYHLMWHDWKLIRFARTSSSAQEWILEYLLASCKNKLYMHEMNILSKLYLGFSHASVHVLESECVDHMWCNLVGSVETCKCDIFSFLFDWSAHLKKYILLKTPLESVQWCQGYEQLKGSQNNRKQ